MEALGINVPGLVAQLINFGLLFLLLRAFLFKPIAGMLDERSRRIKESLDAAENMRRQASSAEAEVRTQIEQARRESQGILQQASQLRDKMIEEAREEARAAAAAENDKAREQIRQERDAAMAQLRGQFVDLAVLAAEKVIRAEVDRNKHQRLISEVLETAPSSNGR
ncbi:MAG: F0F1 ATP synthase subunit B [Chloroflexi bacterium]|nr:F0F1 ATP synthase subunit B [Chloroflexota bacterium]